MMRTKKLSALVGAAITIGMSVVLVPGATADPVNAKDAGTLTLVCTVNGQTQTYHVVTNAGNNHSKSGTWDPAFDLSSTTVLIPTAFGEATQTYTDDATNMVVATITIPPNTKGNSQGAGATPGSCSYEITNTFTLTSSVTLSDGTVLDPGVPYTVVVDSSVTGFIPSQK